MIRILDVTFVFLCLQNRNKKRSCNWNPAKFSCSASSVQQELELECDNAVIAKCASERSSSKALFIQKNADNRCVQCVADQLRVSLCQPIKSYENHAMILHNGYELTHLWHWLPQVRLNCSPPWILWMGPQRKKKSIGAIIVKIWIQMIHSPDENSWTHHPSEFSPTSWSANGQVQHMRIINVRRTQRMMTYEETPLITKRLPGLNSGVTTHQLTQARSVLRRSALWWRDPRGSLRTHAFNRKENSIPSWTFRLISAISSLDMSSTSSKAQ